MGNYTIEENGLVIYRASALGNCSKALYLDRLGMTHEPTPEFMQQKYDEGTAGEQPILDALYKQMHWRLLTPDQLISKGFMLGEGQYEGQVQVWCMVGSSGKLWVRGHIDGVAELWAAGLGQETRLGELRGVEAKLFGKTYWDRYQSIGLDGFTGYQYQLTPYMIGTGLPWLYIVGKKNEKGELEIDENGKAIIDVREIDTPPIPWGRIMGKVLGIEKRLELGNEPDCEKPLQYPCPFYPLHDEADTEQLPDAETLIFDELAENYDRFRRMEEEYKERKKKAGSAIAEFLDSKGLGTPQPPPRGTETAGKKADNSQVKGRSFKVTDIRYWRKGFVDEEKLKADGIDPEAYRQDDSEVRYPRIDRL